MRATWFGLATVVLVLAAAGFPPAFPESDGADLPQKGGKGGGGKATPAERIRVAKDFKVELIYTVPRLSQGSWVNLCALPDGRLVASDQGGAGLYRVTPPPLG